MGSFKHIGHVSKWDVLDVVDMQSMFQYASSFNADLSKWNVSSVTDMTAMFSDARSFDADLSRWDVSRVTDMTDMFKGAHSFSRTLLGAWITSTLEKAEYVYERKPGKTTCKTRIPNP